MHRMNWLSYSLKDLMDNEEDFKAAYSINLTKDGLFPCSQVSIIRDRGFYNLSIGEGEIPVFPTRECWFLCDYFVRSEKLWDMVQLQFTYHYSIFGSAPLRGLDFSKALDIALKEKKYISKFYHPESLEDDIFSSLVFKITSKKNMMQLEVWEYKVNSRHVYYMHALSEDNFQTLTHLDGATIQFTNSEVQDLLFTVEKVKGKNYSKVFRLDGSISFSYLHEIARIFLPLKDLYEEAFNVETFKNCSL